MKSMIKVFLKREVNNENPNALIAIQKQRKVASSLHIKEVDMSPNQKFIIRCRPESVKIFSIKKSESNHKNSLPPSEMSSNEAALFDDQYNKRLEELMQTEKEVQKQIQMLTQANRVTTFTDKEYKRKVVEFLERQNKLLQHLKDVEKSASKWRRTKLVLESQLENIIKCQAELTKQIDHNTNEMACMHKGIADFHKRIEMKKDAINIANLIVKKEPTPKSHEACIYKKNHPDRPLHGKGESAPCPDYLQDDDVTVLYKNDTDVFGFRHYKARKTECGFSMKNVGTDVSAASCGLSKSSGFNISKNMRASQCSQGPATLRKILPFTGRF